MKKFVLLIAVISILIFPSFGSVPQRNLIGNYGQNVFAPSPVRKQPKTFPEGTFRKKRNGDVVQYNGRGKKIGTYKMINGKYEKVK